MALFSCSLDMGGFLHVGAVARDPPMTLHRWTRAAMYDANASGNIRLPPPIRVKTHKVGFCHVWFRPDSRHRSRRAVRQ
jgi:hypothetical protein